MFDRLFLSPPVELSSEAIGESEWSIMLKFGRIFFNILRSENLGDIMILHAMCEIEGGVAW
jgi:hypothetical protein